MMLVFRKLWRGVWFVQQSVRMLMSHPVLLLYAVPPLLGALIKMYIQFNINLRECLDILACTHTRLIIFMVIQALLKTITLMCLAYHVMCILNQEFFSLKRVLTTRLLPNALFIIVISIGTIIESNAYLYMHNSLISIMDGQPYFSYSCGLGAIIGIALSYTLSPLWLAMPIAATESISFIQALKRSLHLIWRYFAIFTGMLITLGMLNEVLKCLILLMSKPLAPLYRILIPNTLLGQLSNPIMVLIITALSLFYYEYYARPKPEQPVNIFSPDF